MTHNIQDWDLGKKKKYRQYRKDHPSLLKREPTKLPDGVLPGNKYILVSRVQGISIHVDRDPAPTDYFSCLRDLHKFGAVTYRWPKLPIGQVARMVLASADTLDEEI